MWGFFSNFFDLTISQTPPPARNLPKSPYPSGQRSPAEASRCLADLNHHSTCPAGDGSVSLPVRLLLFQEREENCSRPGRDALPPLPSPAPLPARAVLCSSAILTQTASFPFVSTKLQPIFFFFSQAISLMRQDCFEVPAHPPKYLKSLPAWYHLQL